MKAEDVKEHWESGAPTTKCETIKRLEVNAIYNAIMDIEGKVGSVLEVGCGNGENLRNLQAFIPRSFFEGYGNTRFCGMDMVEREPEFDGEFRVGNVLGISEVFDEKFEHWPVDLKINGFAKSLYRILICSIVSDSSMTKY